MPKLSRLKSSIAKAKELGYMTDLPLYHGTNKDFDAFDLGRGGEVSRSPVGAQGVSLTPDPEVAGEFANLAGNEGANILKVFHRANNPGSIDLPDNVGNIEVSGYISQAWDEGYDAVRLTNYTTPSGRRGQTVYIIKDPNQVRSVNAKFDPKRKNSADLLAGIGGAGVLAGALSPEDAMAGDLDAVAMSGVVGEWARKRADKPSKWKQFKESILEPTAAVATGLASQPIQGLIGLGALGQGYGINDAVGAMSKAGDAMTYTPGSEQGQESLQSLGRGLEVLSNAPPARFIGDHLDQGADWAADNIHPAAGAALKALPEVVF